MRNLRSELVFFGDYVFYYTFLISEVLKYHLTDENTYTL